MLRDAWGRLCQEWYHHRGCPPSLEQFADAVTRANRARYVSANDVAARILNGRWPR